MGNGVQPTGYEVQIVTDGALPASVDWVMVTDRRTTAYVKGSRVDRPGIWAEISAAWTAVVDHSNSRISPIVVNA